MERSDTGVPRSYENAPPYDPTVARCLARVPGGSQGDLRFRMGEVPAALAPTLRFVRPTNPQYAYGRVLGGCGFL